MAPGVGARPNGTRNEGDASDGPQTLTPEEFRARMLAMTGRQPAKSGASGTVAGASLSPVSHKLRGIYSEHLQGSDPNSLSVDIPTGPKTVVSDGSPVKLSQPLSPTPFASNYPHSLGNDALPPSPGPRISSTAIHIPDGYEKRSMQPKVLAQYEPGAGEAPRQIVIARKKRLYAAQDLEELLLECGVTDGVPGSKPPESKYPPYLPQEPFDDTDFESRTPEEWLALGRSDEGEMKGVPGRALRVRPGKRDWVNCMMKQFDYNRNRYLVEWEDDRTVSWVPRVHLMFLAEDPFVFAQRVAAAHAGRRKAEALLRYNLYVDSMPTDEISGLGQEQVQRILASAMNTEALTDRSIDTSALINEINIDYARTMNKIIFDHNLKDPAQRELFESLELPPADAKKVVPWSGVVPTPEHDFPEQFSEFTFYSFLTKAEVFHALVKVRAECNRVQKLPLFNTTFSKALRLEEFHQLQSQTCSQTANNVKDHWLTTLKNGIKNSLKDVGKGWFNLMERNKEVYEFSKLKRLLSMVHFMMQDTLRFLIEESLDKYVRYFQIATAWKVEVSATNSVEVLEDEIPEIADDGEDSEHLRSVGGLHGRKPGPLFLVDLIIVDGAFTYSTKPDQFEEVPVTLFDKAITGLQDVPELEPSVMELLFWSHIPTIKSVHLMEDRVINQRETVRSRVKAATQPLVDYLATYDRYLELLALDTKVYIEDFENKNPTLDQIKNEVRRHLRIKEETSSLIPLSVNLGMFSVNCDVVRKMLLDKHQKLADLALDLIFRRFKDRLGGMHESFTEVDRKLKHKARNIEEITEMREFMGDISHKLDEINNTMEDAKVYHRALEDFYFELPQSEFNSLWVCIGWPHKIEQQVDRVEHQLQDDETKYMDDLKSDQEVFVNEIAAIAQVVGEFSKHNDISKVATVAAEVKKISKTLDDYQEKSKKFNGREVLFKVDQTDYEDLSKIVRDFEPYAMLWTTAHDWMTNHKIWMTQPFDTLDAETVAKEVSQAFKNMYKAVKHFKEMPDILAIAEQVKAEVDKFKPHTPLITALRNPGMRDRHWDAISADLGFELKPDASFTLTRVFELNLPDHAENITKTCDLAGKEFMLEDALDKMEKEWEEIKLGLMEYKETGSYVVKGVDEISQLLDDHLTTTQAMSFSPYKKAHEERITNWETKLKIVSDVLEELLGCQRQWMYLEPIFSSDDINRQLPTEGKRFATCDRTWRKNMSAAFQNPLAIKWCANEKLLESLQEANKLLELVQKGLSDYLETKRSGFARFYFLSNDELLEILSQTKEPTAVQPHLKKCFEAIATLHFDDDLAMTKMFSVEGECVPFVDKVYPKGNVENWMGEIERMMRRSLWQEMKIAIEAYPNVARNQWVRDYPAQIVLGGAMYYWTKECEDSLNESGLEGITKYYEQVHQQVLDLTELVRSDLTKLERKTLGALIVLEVHNRDVVEMLSKKKVSDISEFEWVSQLRYYWEEHDGKWGDVNMLVRQVQSCQEYSYEYLGNTPRLVITPLTDRCYMTLMGALHLYLGGAPAGPAGTGKTETTKDLAKALGKQCVVFNCSDGLDYLAMGKFFKGLINTGAWACFDEFNRIDIEVLSVIAQQISTIQVNIKAGVERFNFEGTEVMLARPFCGVFITMNPGYAGRSELPDNLKALFRPCAMMVPNYALIGEILLYSFGFKDSRQLATKMVTTFKLSSEQLSSQPHYDFGMRAVRTVINAAGNLKRDFPEKSEELMMLRALQDSNVPKFLNVDLPLFSGIISDIFPGVEPWKPDYGDLLRYVNKVCEDWILQPTQAFTLKVIQLYEMTVVRHGLMLVGPAGGGKTRCYKVLQEAMIRLKRDGIGIFENVQSLICNPKSVTMGQLYGQFDENTHEWTDGVLATLYRIFAQDECPDKKWLMFDGPVDAIWIENMNTVLDDNKKLCLVSGEIIQMSSTMTMMFEVEDLSVASPATVSRCGMVYMEPETEVPLQSLIRSWVQRIPEKLKVHGENIEKLFMAYIPDMLHVLRREWRETVATLNNNLVLSMFNLMDSFIDPHVKEAPENLNNLPDLMEPLFIFSMIWSCGASLDLGSRKKFDKYLRQQMEKHTAVLTFPSDGLVFDYCLDFESKDWVEWQKLQPDYVLDPKTPFSEILVPTIDTMRSKFIITQLLLHHNHILCVGNTGTGKTANILEKLLKDLSDKYIPLQLGFSAQTSANMTQDIVDGKLDRRRKGVFGPPSGQRYVIFVDDVNMPQREKYFAQPPIELLRQWLDHKGWYDRRALVFREIIDIQFIGAMGPPGGGRNPVSNRFLRHFNFLSFTDLEDSSLRTIFGTILSVYSKAFYPAEVTAIADKVVNATIKVYRTISHELLPTPTKSHYTFNLRDISKVFQGVMMCQAKTIVSPNDLCRLWAHECLRVFQDRLTSIEDRDWFDVLLRETMSEYFGAPWEEVVTMEPLLFGDFLIPGADPKYYCLIDDVPKMQGVIEEYLEDYNAQTNQPMNLVMFMEAIQHCAKISRVLRQPMGNALLLGVGGSGRQSLTRLASFMAEYDCFQIEIAKGYGMTEWREDVRRVLLKAGLESKGQTFLFSDTQIVLETFLEDLNNVLNTGEVPNIMGLEHLDEIFTTMRPIAQSKGIAQTKLALYNLFLSRVRSNLHLVICMSPIGDAFRNRLRKFPSLVNCCTIDWFLPWPGEALRSVAIRALKEVELEDHVKERCVDLFVEIHTSVEAKSTQYLQELRRYNYVTPTSYLELMSTYQRLLFEKRDEVGTLRSRLATGLDKLNTTAEAVAVMQEELTALQPVLAQTSKDVDEMMVNIEKDKASADVTKAEVEKEEEEASQKAKETEAIAADAQRDLDEALPALEKALASLKNLNRNDIVEVRSMGRPPAGVKLTMEAVCIMFEKKPKKVAHETKVGVKVDDYWEPGKNLLADPSKFLDNLIKFDKDNIKEDVIRKITPYVENPEFTPEIISKASKACTSICEWVLAMEKYYHVSKAVEPKREKLKEAQAVYAVTMESLQEAKARLQAVQDRINFLESEYEKSVAKKEELAFKVEDCTQKLERAHRLIGGLGGEKTRWAATVESLGGELISLTGDVLIAAGTIAYAGPFTPEYRLQLVEGWVMRLGELEIPHTPNCSMRGTLQDPVKIRAWTIAGLPTDNHSVENGIIASKARRWSLCVDPQGQANKWIKNMEKETGLEVVKLSDKKFLQTLENSIRFGRPVLLENILEELDPALEPLLLRQTFKQGGSEMIKLGDNTIPYHPDFKFYITTKLRNPHYSPETSVKVSLLNFTITPGGLEEQLLGITVAKERPDLEEMKNQLVVSNATMKKELKDIEDKILFLLSNSQGNILDDEELINTLAASKKTSVEINNKLAEAEKTEHEIDVTRENYRPVAFHTSLLFFTVADLAGVDPMYQYSLQWFINLYVLGIENAPQDADIDNRLQNLKAYFTYSLYQNVCRSLFEVHKLLFSFLLCIKILQGNNQVDHEEWRFLISGGTSTSAEEPNPCPEWLQDQVWVEICDLARLPNYKGIDSDFASCADGWRLVFDSETAHKEPFPGDWDDSLSPFQKMLVLRCLRIDKMVPAIMQYVTGIMGEKFIEPPPFDLPSCYADSSVLTPLIFVLSPGADPNAELMRFAEDMKFAKKLQSISLGQGQGPIAEKMIQDAEERGTWIMLQNCHLAASWMPSLERMVEAIDKDKVHKDFRLWLTSMPSPAFPVLVLQNGVKMTNEPPKGLRPNLRGMYIKFDESYLEASKKPREWMKLLFSINLFHAIVLERRKFGPLGWNIAYDFTIGDLQVCQMQIQSMLDEYETIPYKVLRELAGHINYGGRVTDDWDRRTMMTLLDDYICEGALEDGYKFNGHDAFVSPNSDLDKDGLLEFIHELPLEPSPVVFGLHPNAEITCNTDESLSTFSIIQSLQPRGASGGAGSKTQEQIIEEHAQDFADRLPPNFDLYEVQKQYPVVYEESMNTVLQQECIRYNNLLTEMRTSLQQMLKALKGLVVMSDTLDEACTSIFNNTVPAIWESKAYPSLKPLGLWYEDLLQRITMLQKWFASGIPSVFWISGFFFPQAFLTGTLQNYARKYVLPIDTISFEFKVLNMSPEDLSARPDNGCYIHGLFLEGARWDPDIQSLADSIPKELYCAMPVIWLRPRENREAPDPSTFYNAPTYKELTRKGTLSTTGHSTNYILPIEIPTKDPPEKWIKAGVALFCALRY
eukprot:Rmarinus@m.24609